MTVTTFYLHIYIYIKWTLKKIPSNISTTQKEYEPTVLLLDKASEGVTSSLQTVR